MSASSVLKQGGGTSRKAGWGFAKCSIASLSAGFTSKMSRQCVAKALLFPQHPQCHRKQERPQSKVELNGVPGKLVFTIKAEVQATATAMLVVIGHGRGDCRCHATARNDTRRARPWHGVASLRVHVHMRVCRARCQDFAFALWGSKKSDLKSILYTPESQWRLLDTLFKHSNFGFHGKFNFGLRLRPM